MLYFLMLAGLLVFCSPITPAKPNQDGSSDRHLNDTETDTGKNTLDSVKQLDYFLYISVKAFCSCKVVLSVADKQLFFAEIIDYTS